MSFSSNWDDLSKVKIAISFLQWATLLWLSHLQLNDTMSQTPWVVFFLHVYSWNWMHVTVSIVFSWVTKVMCVRVRTWLVIGTQPVMGGDPGLCSVVSFYSITHSFTFPPHFCIFYRYMALQNLSPDVNRCAGLCCCFSSLALSTSCTSPSPQQLSPLPNHFLNRWLICSTSCDIGVSTLSNKCICWSAYLCDTVSP